MTISSINQAKKISKNIEEHKVKTGLSYIDAIIHYCSLNHLELEDSHKFLTPSLQKKLDKEAQALHFIPKRKSIRNKVFK